MRTPFDRKLSFSALFILGAALSCTAVVADDPGQCSTDADCAARGADFAGSVCNAQNICEPASVNTVGECAKTSDCKAKGADLICSSRTLKCVSPVSPDCTVAYGDPKADNVVLFGLMSEVGRGDTLYFRQSQHLLAAKLAFQEFFDKNNLKLPGNRPAALISCSEHLPRRAAAHLANIGVKAVMGPAEESRQRAVIETLSEAGIAAFTPWMNGNPSAVLPGSTKLAWITSFIRPEVVAPLNAVVAEQEARIRTQLGVANIRVAVLINTPTTSSYNQYAEYGDLMAQRLKFNGKTAIENEKDVGCNNCYKRFDTSQATPDIVAARAAAIAAFAPHIVIPFADIDWGAQLLPELEKIYATKPADVVRPTYVQVFAQNEDQGYKALPVADAAVRKRITGVRPVRDNSFELFQNKFTDAYRPPSDKAKLGQEPNRGAGGAFETSLLLLFASYAALMEKPDFTARDLVAAIPKVTDPTAAGKVTLNDISAGIQQLNAKNTIKLNGLFTFFDFDLATSTAKPTWTTWCVSDIGQYNSSNRVFDGAAFPAGAECQ